MPRRSRHGGERGIEVIQVVILAAAFAAICLAAVGIIKNTVLTTANGIQTK